MIKIVLGLIVGFLIGAGCRYFDIPAPSPPVLPGALLVVAMTLGYSATDRLLNRTDRTATTKHLCGGPTGLPASARASGTEQRCEDDLGRANAVSNLRGSRS
jgi:XapX domain-containing protein